MKKCSIDLTDLNAEQSSDFNRIYRESREEFGEFVGAVLSKNVKGSKVARFCSILASRNHFMSPFLIKLAHLKLVEEKLREGEGLEVIVDSDDMCIALSQNFSKKGLELEMRSSFWDKVSERWVVFCDFLKMIYWMLMMLSHRSQRRKAKVLERPSVTLVETWFLTSSFSQGTFRDRNYGSSYKELDESERENLFFVPQILPLRNWGYMIEKAHESEENFLFVHDFVGVSDYFWTLGQMLGMGLKSEPLHLSGVEVSAIVKKELWQRRFHLSTALGLIHYRFAKRLGECGLDIPRYVDWFENQPQDKGLHLGLREFLSDTEAVGYVGGIVDHDANQYMTPTMFEVEALPKKIALMGEGMMPRFVELSGRVDLEVAPAFRYGHLWRPHACTREVVLIALPFVVPEARKMMSIVMEDVTLFDPEVSILVKLHPSLDHESLEHFLPGPALGQMKRVHGDFFEFLSQAKVLISSMSSVCMESVALGVPTIVVNSGSGLDQKPIPTEVSDSLWRECKSGSDFQKVFHDLNGYSEGEIRQIEVLGDRVKREYFSPIEAERLRPFFGVSPREN
jgi:hypothetical protein